MVKNSVCITRWRHYAVDVVMARAKRIYILIIKVNKLFSFSSSRCFLKEIENTYSVFLFLNYYMAAQKCFSGLVWIEFRLNTSMDVNTLIRKPLDFPKFFVIFNRSQELSLSQWWIGDGVWSKSLAMYILSHSERTRAALDNKSISSSLRVINTSNMAACCTSTCH